MTRRSDYDPDVHPDLLVELGKKGMSVTEMAAHIGIGKRTFYDWIGRHEAFADAHHLAQTHCQAWWEATGRAGLWSKDFNAAVWARNMGSRFRDDWTERTEVDNRHRLDMVPDDELAARVRAAEAKLRAFNVSGGSAGAG